MLKLPVTTDKDYFYISKEFLEDYPLYRYYPLQKAIVFQYAKYPQIKGECPNCRDVHSFNFKDFDQATWMNQSIRQTGTVDDLYKTYSNKILNLNYECKGCNTFIRSYSLKFDEAGKKVAKIGQSPQQSIQIPPDIEKTLSTHSEFYKKGLICESNSFGVAAFAYYRRVMELIILDLLNSAKDLIHADKKNEFEAAITAISQDHTADDKIKIAASMIPGLMGNGENPLKLIYEILSAGIHGLSEEECLDLAIDVRRNIIAFVHQLNVSKESTKALSESTQKLLKKRAELLAKQSKS